jgi:hypothetical protein
MKKILFSLFFTQMVLFCATMMLFTGLAQAQTQADTIYGPNMLTNGGFGSSTGWTDLFISGAATTIDYNYATVPAGGTAPGLRFSLDGTGSNSAIYQAVALDAAKLYQLSAVVRQVGGAQFWLEIWLLNTKPTAGTDVVVANYPSAINPAALKPAAWGGVDNYNGPFSGALPIPSGTFTVKSSGTYYFIIKAGCLAIPAPMDLLIDNVVLKEGSISLLANGAFSSGNTGWTSLRLGTDSCTLDFNYTAQSPKNSQAPGLRITGVNNDNSWGTQTNQCIYQAVTLDSAKNYRLNFSAKNLDVTGYHGWLEAWLSPNKPQLGVDVNAAFGATNIVDNSIWADAAPSASIDGPYNTTAKQFTAPSNGSFYIVLKAGTFGVGHIDYVVDDLILEDVTPKQVFPTDSVTGLAVAAGGPFTNVISWNAVKTKPSVTYNVFVADHPWTNPTDTTVGDIPPYNIPNLNATHLLRAPNANQNLTYYYGVQAGDASGVLSGTSLTASITTLAQGVPTIAKTPPAKFVADGDLSEWITAGIKPFSLSKESGTAHAPTNQVIDNDADCSAKVYLAVDANNLYVAYDVTDDVVKVDTTGNTGPDYEQDRGDLFIGLYDWRGKFHGGLQGGVTPDYHVLFEQNRLRLDGLGVTLMYAYPDGVHPNPNYAWVQKIVSSGYTVEAKIPFTMFANAAPTRHDVLFAPTEGMRIPIDLEIMDRDNKTVADYRDGMLCYSPMSNDDSHTGMWHWTYTWIGNLMNPVTSVKQLNSVPVKYALSQNYPNPFNPSTQIRYSLEKAGNVSLRVYDMLGREIATLVDAFQNAGSYVATFNMASQNLATGVYFYRLEAGSFVATSKMMLLK